MIERLRSWLVAGLAAAALAACTVQNATVSNDTLMRQFKDGDAALSCEINCQLAWVSQRPKALQLHNSGQWHDLALLVMKVGYRSDLTYYYLGRAAQDLGDLPAAVRYYNESERLSNSDQACARGTNSCDGFVFPGAVDPRLQDVQAELATPPPAPEHKVVRRYYPKKKTVAKPASTSASASSSTPAGVYMPPPAASSTGGGAGTTPSPSPSGQNPSGVYLPPAQH